MNYACCLVEPHFGTPVVYQDEVLIFGQKVVLDQSCTILYFWLYQQVDKIVKFWGDVGIHFIQNGGAHPVE